jgi:hypothetical protein
MSLDRKLSRIAVRLRDLQALASLDPRRIARRIVNKQIGRAMGKVASRLYLRRRKG